MRSQQLLKSSGSKDMQMWELALVPSASTTSSIEWRFNNALSGSVSASHTTQSFVVHNLVDVNNQKLWYLHLEPSRIVRDRFPEFLWTWID